MKILVTGGTVFASRYTAEYFAEKGHDVYVLNRGNRPQSSNVHHICKDRYSLGDELKQLFFDAVLDVTSYNVNDVRTLNEALGEYENYIFISSSAVYPETLPQPFREDMECGANSIWGEYGTNKLAAEEWLGEHVPNAYILRPPYLYGTMNNLYREAFVFECAEENRPFYVPKDGRMKLQFFHIDDMCRFMELLLSIKPEQHIFNVGNPQAVSIAEWVQKCYSVVGKKPELRFVSGDVPQRSYFPFYDYEYMLDVSAMCRIMSELKPLEDGLNDSYRWYRENRGLIVRKPLLEYISQSFK